MTASEVHEQSVKPLHILRRLEDKYWNIEVDRLVNQIRSEPIALTGMKFFSITRRLLFGVSLVSIQFSSKI